MKRVLVFLLLFIPQFVVYAANTCPSYYSSNAYSEGFHFFTPNSIPLNVQIIPSKENELIVYIYGNDFMEKIDKAPYRREYYLKEKQQINFEFCKNNKQLDVFSIHMDKKTMVKCIETNKIDCIQNRKLKLVPTHSN